MFIRQKATISVEKRANVVVFGECNLLLVFNYQSLSVLGLHFSFCVIKNHGIWRCDILLWKKRHLTFNRQHILLTVLIIL